MIFQLEPWEVFEAPVNAAGDTVPIHEVWIDEHRRIYGASVVHPDPVWLHPDKVPGRVVRRDPSTPRHPDEWRLVIKAGQTAIDLDSDEKLAARLAAIPEPEIRARPATLAEMPSGMRSVAKGAHAAGFTMRASYARGPRLDQHWKVVETSDNIQLKGWHLDGRRYVLTYITKTPGEDAKNAGIPAWKPDIGYALVAGIWEPCGPTALMSYFTNGSLTKEPPR